jgi:hypothetical protein
MSGVCAARYISSAAANARIVVVADICCGAALRRYAEL